jgi:AAA domain/Toprim domain
MRFLGAIAFELTGTYLEKKAIPACGARLQGDSTILVPMYDGETRELVNIQSITPDGEKRFMKGGKVAGCCFAVGPTEDASPDTVFVCEGFATACSIYEATGRPVIVAFSAVNLAATVAWVKERASDVTRVMVAADNDEKGMKAIPDGCMFIIPAPGYKDFNDMAALAGLDAVKEQLFPGECDDWDIKAPDPMHKKPPSDFTLYEPGEFEWQPYIIKERYFLPRSGIGLIGGQSGAGKTFVVVDLAVSVASGQPFFGLPIKQLYGVAYVATEGGAGLTKRIAAAIAGRETKPRIPIAYLTEGIGDLMKTENVRKLIEKLKRQDSEFVDLFGVPLGLVIIDTVATSFIMEDENAKDAVAVANHMSEISKATSAFVLGVHHYGKNQELGLRGSSAFRANVDQVIAVLARRDGKGNVKKRELALEKNREGVEGDLGRFELTEITLGTDRDRDPIMSCHVAPVTDWDDEAEVKAPKPAKVTQQDLALDALHEAIERHGIRPHGVDYDCATDDQWRELFREYAPDAGKNAFARQRNKLLEVGAVATSGLYVYVPKYTIQDGGGAGRQTLFFS